MTHGIVSAVARTGVGVSDYQFFIQTDAAINPGNSGGALLDLRGDLIGINSAIYSRSGGSQGIGFAIPANIVRVFLAAAGSGKLVTGWIGAEGEAVTADSARLAGLDRPGGVLVTAVSPGSPAAAAGIRVGDVLTAIDGKDVADPGMLRYRIATQGVGTRLEVSLLRAGHAAKVALVLAKPPETPPRSLTTIGGDNLLAGVTVANLSPAFAQELGAGLPEHGVVVTAVAPGSLAAQFGYVAPGDIVEAVNGRLVGSVAAIGEAVRGGAPAVRINRGGQRQECGVVQGQLACRSG